MTSGKHTRSEHRSRRYGQINIPENPAFQEAAGLASYAASWIVESKYFMRSNLNGWLILIFLGLFSQ